MNRRGSDQVPPREVGLELTLDGIGDLEVEEDHRLGEQKNGSYNAWLVTISCSIVHALHTASVFIGPSTLLSPMRKDLNLSVKEISLPLNVNRLINTLFLIPAGIFLDKSGTEKPLVISIIVASVVCFFWPLSTSLWQLVAIQAILAFTILMGGLTPMLIIASRMFESVEKMSMVTSILLAGFSLMGFVTPLLLGPLADRYGWRTTSYLFPTLLSVIGLPLVLRNLTSKRSEGSSRVRSLRSASTPTDGTLWMLDSTSPNMRPMGLTAEAPKENNSREPRTSPPLMTMPYFAVLGAAAGLSVCLSIVNDHLIIFLSEDVGYPLRTATTFMSFIHLIALGAKLSSGIAGQHFRKGVLLILAAISITTSALLLLEYHDSELQLTSSNVRLSLFAPFYAIGYGSMLNLLTSVLPEAGSANLALRSNIYSLVISAVQAMGSYAAGVLKTTSGSYLSTIILFTCACFAQILFCLLFVVVYKPTVSQDTTANRHWATTPTL
uniref:Major facilitator superfamily (MFS) profile domain-containing protein n=1 Tax=Rhodosorus marinus TaxID=101924 RepID=A0A7S3A5E8_9RHOD|mmetsp:Transcript_42061/g.164706  ORF Transcript_42061/g.164706 Transcript_42061/m.164706 type:complete len:495 (+) Transcript_42061:95-1579(+)